MIQAQFLEVSMGFVTIILFISKLLSQGAYGDPIFQQNKWKLGGEKKSVLVYGMGVKSRVLSRSAKHGGLDSHARQQVTI